MGKIRGIIFDLDGTLVHLPIKWQRIVEQIEGLLGVKIGSLLDLYVELWGTESYESVSHIVEEFEMAALDKLEILDDSPQLLRRLSVKYNLGIVTFQSRTVARKVIEKIGINGLVMATRNDSPTRIGQISRVVSASSLSFKDFLVVGDRLNDVYSALKVGCKAVLVDRIGRDIPIRELRKFIVISNLKNLPSIIEKENERH